jgi:hypothetical protein
MCIIIAMVAIPKVSESTRNAFSIGTGGLVVAVAALAARHFKDGRWLQLGVLASGPAAGLTFTAVPVKKEKGD